MGDRFPASERGPRGGLVDLIPQVAPTAVEQQRLLVDNPVRLYGFSAQPNSLRHVTSFANSR